MNKFVVMAEKQVGKTTLVKKILEKKQTNVCGYFTQRYLELADESGLYPIYIHSINEKPILDDNHIIGLCGNGKHYTNHDVFNSLGVDLITTNNPNDLIILDEVGFLEMNAEKFKNKIFEILSSDNPVLIMLKQRLDIELLRKIKENENIEFIEMNENNRDEICEYLLNKLV